MPAVWRPNAHPRGNHDLAASAAARGASLSLLGTWLQRIFDLAGTTGARVMRPPRSTCSPGRPGPGGLTSCFGVVTDLHRRVRASAATDLERRPVRPMRGTGPTPRRALASADGPSDLLKPPLVEGATPLASIRDRDPGDANPVRVRLS